MRCPRCNFAGELVDGACPHCGYQLVNVSENLLNTGASGTSSLPTLPRSPSSPLRSQSGVLRSPSSPLRPPSGILRSPSVPLRALPSGPLRSPSIPLRSFTGPLRPISLYAAKSGDTLNQGRYRLVDQLALPDNQQAQGAAWLAIDTGGAQVVIREVVVPPEEQANKKQIAQQVAARLFEGAQHTGFPRMLNIFNELDDYFIVFQHIEGESLASLLRRQEGALPEQAVAEYGRQLCEMLTALSNQPGPIIHGGISPETVIISPDRNQVHLIHLPLFPPERKLSTGSSAGYKAPELMQGVLDPASDLYSVAATMHHAVTGFDPRERIAFLYPPARRLNPAVSVQMESILMRALQLSTSQRYARAADMQAELTALLGKKALIPVKKQAGVAGDPLKRDLLEMRKRGRQRSLRQLGIFGAICLLILGIGLFAYTYPPFKPPITSSATSTPDPAATAAALQRALNTEWQAEAPLYQTKGIGLSDGRYVFDTYTGRAPAEVNFKKEAAQALLYNNMAAALHDYAEAVTSDKTDAEARIYYEDLQIEAQHDPYITIVLGLPLDRSEPHLAIARPDLQAAFAFQNQVNTQNPDPLPGGVKLRILIDNSGALDSNVTTVAQFIANRVQLGNLDHIVAVVGWPTSTESSYALPVLAAVKIPMVTLTAPSTSLAGSGPDSFSVGPDDAVQGKAQAQFAYQVLGARRVLVLCDQNNSSSKTLADTFTSNFVKLGGTVVDDPMNSPDYFTEGQTTVTQFEQQAAQKAIINHVDLIFLPGLDVDAIRLARALGIEENTYGWSAYLAGLKILGDNSVDTNLILGKGAGLDAALAQDDPQDMQRLIFTSFANEAEWGTRPPAFLTNWQKLYGTPTANNPSAPVPSNTAIMANDAFGVLTYAMGLVKGPLTGENLRNTLASIGTAGIKPYQGLSGPLAFDSAGNPINKKMMLLAVVPARTAGQNTIQLIASTSTSG